MTQVSRADWMTYTVSDEERRALNYVISSYVSYLEANVKETAERAVVIAVLHNLQLRMNRAQAGDDGYFTIRITYNEGVAFAGAVLVFQQLITYGIASSRWDREAIRHVFVVQKRFVERGRQQAGHL